MIRYTTIDELRKAGKPVYIFGAGVTGKQAALSINDKAPEIEILGFFDNEWTLWGKRVVLEFYCEKPSLKDALCLVAASKGNANMIADSAMELGYKYIYIWNPEDGKEYDVKYIDLLNKRTPRKKLYFVVDVVEHCNLNCQMCDHFAPLSDEHYITIESYKKDIERIGTLYRDEITFICLEGGEPLLHPQIAELVLITKQILPDTQIYIFTTGIEIGKMDEKFWDACRKTGLVLSVTKYPISFDYKSMEQLCKKNNVDIRYFSGEKEIKTSIHKPIDEKGNRNIYDSFHRCHMANGDCADLKEGKLFPCTFAANIHIFNAFFNKKIEISNKDYINIFDDITAQRIGEFLSNPIPACRYCDVKHTSYGNKWKTSKQDIREWI